MLIFCRCPRKPLLANDWGVLGVVYTIGKPLRAFREEGDERVISTQGYLLLGGKHFPATLV